MPTAALLPFPPPLPTRARQTWTARYFSEPGAFQLDGVQIPRTDLLIGAVSSGPSFVQEGREDGSAGSARKRVPRS
ncbi:hypothetical protein DHEL01_v205672 [Diaporthe helianthi]|uniref:Uncharacterized protein n=1 Tax=Diaporthe helianthi TaxID=158607 RepID=A0A2P5I0C0_DIAHE|nr:hypothetical protein DHEL01_v205672 [Diaporthe helianthi]